VTEPPADLDRLRRLLGGEPTAWLVDRVRRRLAGSRELTGTVTLADASPEQRRAVERLMGRRAGTGTSVTVSLDDLDALLRRSGASPDGLAAAVVRLGGEVPERAALAAAEIAAWSAAFAPVEAVIEARPELAPWRQWLEATGTVRRLTSGPEEAADLLDSLARVLARLPSFGIALGRLAAETTGDAHALDDGRPLATLSLAAARALTGAPPSGGGGAAERRTAWAAVGVHIDDLSSTALCLGLPGGAGTVTGRTLAVAREAGDACVLTLRQLVRDASDLAVGARLVYLCENPVVLASVADELGVGAPPVVCVNGQPSTATWALLTALRDGGARFAYHGDFDWGGLRIANQLYERVPWTPWRFDTASYENAVARWQGGPLSGRRTDALWDPGLAHALARHGIRVEEELVIPDLLSDLIATRP
jgi:uncharacterized protein (TIGR02679 family)